MTDSIYAHKIYTKTSTIFTLSLTKTVFEEYAWIKSDFQAENLVIVNLSLAISRSVSKSNCHLPMNRSHSLHLDQTSKFLGDSTVKEIIRSTIRLKLFITQSRLLTTLRKKPFETIVGRGENAGNQHFLLFPQCFLPFPKQFQFLIRN